MEEYLLLRHLDIPEHHHLTQQAVVHHIQHLVQEAAISRKVTAQQAAAIRLIVQGLQYEKYRRTCDRKYNVTATDICTKTNHSTSYNDSCGDRINTFW